MELAYYRTPNNITNFGITSLLLIDNDMQLMANHYNDNDNIAMNPYWQLPRGGVLCAGLNLMIMVMISND